MFLIGDDVIVKSPQMKMEIKNPSIGASSHLEWVGIHVRKYQ